MRLMEDYLQLRKSFPQAGNRQLFQVSMGHLAECLYCGQRNAKIIIGKMVELGWISFQSGLGRGHTSEIAFLVDGDELIMNEAEERVRSGDVASALKLIQEHGEGSSLQRRFLDWFYMYFGYHVDDSTEQLRETLRVPVYRPITTLDPSKVFYALDCHLASQIFNTLVEHQNESDSISGGIAHHWERNEDATEWTFYLRKGIRFHHGRELNADDVTYSLQRLQHSTQSWVVHGIKEFKVISRYTVQFRLEQSNYYLLYFLSYVTSSIVHKDVYEPWNGGEPEIPVGTGPFKAVRRTNGSCLLQAFDHYYHVRPHIDEVEIIVIPENPDTTYMPAKDHLLQIQTGEENDGDENGWEKRESMSGVNVLTVNMKKTGILTESNFRAALVYMIDRQQMVHDLGRPRTKPARNFGLSPDAAPASSDLDYCPKKGRRLLQLSGYKGEPLRLHTYERHAPDAYWLQEQYLTYGINLEVTIVPWADMLNPSKISEADLILFEAVLSEGMIRLLDYYLYENSFIRMHLHDGITAAIDEHVKAFVQAVTEERRISYLQSIEQMLKQDNAIIFLTCKSISSLAHPSLRNVRLHPRGWVDFKQLWLQNSNST